MSEDAGPQKRYQLKLVRLLDPEMCTDCRFSSIKIVETENRQPSRVISCSRKDCDNWITQETKPEKIINCYDEYGNPESF